ncbi:MAG: ribokinase [Clostridiales bacterium]|nr:ribokinase [Clostridiales bacterium]
MNRQPICVLGSLNIDLTVTLERFHQPGETVNATGFSTFTGGKGGNQAVAAARLGAEVHMVACVGDDTNAGVYRAALDEAGIGRDYLFVEPALPTGVALIEVDARGENRIAVVAGANAALTADRVSQAGPLLPRCGLLLLQLETPIEAVHHAAALARQAGGRVILDPAPARPLSDGLLQLCDLITPNEHELGIVTGLPSDDEDQAIAACAQLIRRGARAVVNKRGRRGALLVTPEGAVRIPGYRVDAVDTTAAGDTFNAGLAVGLSMDLPLPDAVRLANAAAALSTTAMGAQGAMPALGAALALIDEGEIAE